MKKYKPYWLGFALFASIFVVITGLWFVVGRLVGAFWPQAGFSIGRKYSLMLSLGSRSGQIFWLIVALVIFGGCTFVFGDMRSEYRRYRWSNDAEAKAEIGRVEAGFRLHFVMMIAFVLMCVGGLIIHGTTDTKLTPLRRSPSSTPRRRSSR